MLSLLKGNILSEHCEYIPSYKHFFEDHLNPSIVHQSIRYLLQ